MDGAYHATMMIKLKSLEQSLRLRKVLRQWHSQISNPTKIIDNNKVILSLLDIVEEF
jgi:hypothetical protein